MSPALPRPASLAVFSLLLPLGAWIGLLLLRGSPAGRLAVALSFGAAALLYLVTEELLIETRLPEETLLSRDVLPRLPRDLRAGLVRREVRHAWPTAAKTSSGLD